MRMRLLNLVVAGMVLITAKGFAGDDYVNMAGLKTLKTFSEFIKAVNGKKMKEISPAIFQNVVAVGQALKEEQPKLTKEDLKALHAHHGRSWADGREQTWIFYQLPKDTRLGYKIDIRYSLDGTYEFLYNYPMDPKTKEIPDDHVQTFLRFAKDQDFHPMRFKGPNVFKKGNVVSATGMMLMKPYLKETKGDTRKYVFYRAHGDAGRAHVELTLDADGKVTYFDAMEARYIRETPKK